MNHIHHAAVRRPAMLALALTVSACGPSTKTPTPPDPGPVVTARQEDQFGVQFGSAFRADNNAEPVNVNDGDIVAVSLTTEPVDVK